MIDDILRAAESVADEAEVFFARIESISADLKQDKIAIGSKSRGSGIIIRIIKDGKISNIIRDDKRVNFRIPKKIRESAICLLGC